MSEPRSNVDPVEALLRQRDDERERSATGRSVIRARDLPWQSGRLGKIKWYLHPLIRDTVIHNYIFYMQEIAPGGRTARVRMQGNEVLLILEGRGYTSLDGMRHEWKAGDMVGLPLREDGFVVQHFNRDASAPARFVSARPDLTGSLGVDHGSGFEILEDAPRSDVSGARAQRG
ncbi:MAG: hypothetical protein ACRDGB_00155 [Candidatus Limnocylindria bacterium]